MARKDTGLLVKFVDVYEPAGEPAYARGSVASAFKWPLPSGKQPGEWTKDVLRFPGDRMELCRRGYHAFRPDQMPLDYGREFATKAARSDMYNTRSFLLERAGRMVNGKVKVAVQKARLHTHNMGPAAWGQWGRLAKHTRRTELLVPALLYLSELAPGDLYGTEPYTQARVDYTAVLLGKLDDLDTLYNLGAGVFAISASRALRVPYRNLCYDLGL